MALREIRVLGDNLLRKRSRKVEKIDNRIKVLLEDMAETMYVADGVGLAAPQIGILKRIIVVDVGEGIIKLINPEIIWQDGYQVDEEGCLSVPQQKGNVKRPQKVKVKGLNENGEEVIVEGDELLACALCHEIDHLDGILFIDKVVEDGE